MKALIIKLIGVGLLFAAVACQNPGHHTVIKTGDNNNTTKIEYNGNVYFNVDGTGIAHISPNGSAKYQHNNRELIAESDNQGNITYRIDGGKSEAEPAAYERAFVAGAIKEMIKQGHNN